MTISELLTVTFLSWFDRAMDFITRGQWGKARGDQRVVIKIRKQN